METKQIIETIINQKAKYHTLPIIVFDMKQPIKYTDPKDVYVLKTLSYVGSDGELTTYALCLSEDGEMFHSHISQLTFAMEGK